MNLNVPKIVAQNGMAIWGKGRQGLIAAWDMRMFGE